MSERDDEDWLDALAGRDGTGDASLGRREGSLLREAVRTRRAVATAEGDAGPGDAAEDETRRGALISRARDVGLLPAADGGAGAPDASATRDRPGRRGRSSMLQPLLLAAALGGLAVGLAWQLRPLPTDAPTRAAPGRAIRLEAPDPAAFQRELVTALRAAGVDARGYEQFDVRGVDADLPRPLPPEVRRVLDAFGIEPPPDGVLQVEIRARR